MRLADTLPAALLAVIAYGNVGAQGVGSVPAYTPLNPIMSARSPLASQPFRDTLTGWRFDVAVDYGSATELDVRSRSRYVLDAELVRVLIGGTHDLGADHFVLLEGGIGAAHRGFADAFFDEFHALIGYDQRARAERPRNAFAYTVELASGERVEHGTARVALTDLRAGIGRRHSRYVQSLLAVTLPTSTAPDGYRHAVPSAGFINTARLQPHERIVLEGTLSGAYAPKGGALRSAQRTTFVAASTGVVLRMWQSHALYGSRFYHSPTYEADGLPEVERGELTVDFGVLLRDGRTEWRIGLVEDTRATDGGIDLILRLGVGWQPSARSQ